MPLEFSRREYRQIEDNINQLSPTLQQKVWGRSYSASLRPVRDAARASTLFKDRTGNLRSNFRISTSRKALRRVVKARGLQVGAVLINQAPHSYLVHEGTSRGAKARPYLYRALEKAQNAILPAFRIAAVRNFQRLVTQYQNRTGVFRLR